MGYPAGPLYRLLILTGLRLNEVADAKWSEFNSRNGIWIVPAARVKKAKMAASPTTLCRSPTISPRCKSLPRFKSGDFVFSATFGKTPVWVSDKIKKRLDAPMRALRALARRRGDDPSRVTLPPWVNHDLRRTLRTGLSKLRVDRDIREAVLAHTRPVWREFTIGMIISTKNPDALLRWAAHMQSLATPAVLTNVVRLRG